MYTVLTLPVYPHLRYDPNVIFAVQVVGYKSIWLAPPEASPGMYVFSSAPDPSGRDHDSGKPNQDPKREGMMGNTSSIDVFSLSALDTSDTFKT
ncbi:hypothetical protein FRC11_005657, partial [Ceratobasidium sp. 423]